MSKFPERLLAAGFQDFSTLVSWTPSVPARLPTFPTLYSLTQDVDNAGQSTPMPPVETSIFKTLIGDVRSIYYEFLEDPTRFEPQSSELIQLLASGAVKISELSKEQLEVMDRATYAMMEPRHKTSVTPSQPVQPELPPALEHLMKGSDEDDEELAYTDDGRLIPLRDEAPIVLPEAPTFWWLKD